MISLLRTLFIVLAGCLSLSGCALVLCLIDTDISHTPRFKNVAGHELLTRKKLYLYAPDNNGADDVRLLYVLHSQNTSNPKPLAIIPAGHPLRINKVIRQHDIEDSSEDMYGEVTLKGTTYPLKFWLGFTSRPNDWRQIYDMFVIKE